MVRELDFVDEYYSEKDLSLLKKCTLVIPTYNRNYYLSRCLWYHTHFPFDEIIIADSSTEDKRKINRKTVQTIQTRTNCPHITYLEYDFPAEKYGGEIYRKWGDAVQHVNTEYSLSCTDKEFLIPTSVSKSIDYLDKYTDYSIADGCYYMVESKNLIYQWQGGISLDEADVSARLQKVLNAKCIFGTQFALQRASIHKKIYDNLDRYELYDLRFGETEIELFPIIAGRTHRDMSIPMSCRDITHSFEKKGVVKMEKKSESSFLRYPFIKDYPKEYILKLSNNIQFCLEESAGKEYSKELSACVKDIIDKRYQTTPITKHNTLHNIWVNIWVNYIPYKLKYFLSRNLGAGLVSRPLKRNEIPYEIKLAMRIISQSREYYNTDSVPPIYNRDVQYDSCN